MSTPPPTPPDPSVVWPPPPVQPDLEPTRRPFVSLIPLSRAVALFAVIDLIGYVGVTTLRSHSFTSGSPITDALTKIFAGFLYLAAFVVYRVLFLRWIFLAYRNLDTFETAGLETTPGWAVGWFFVPIVNLYRPYLIVHELWKAGAPDVDSRDEIAWQRVVSPPLIGWWWASALLYIFLPRMLDRVLTHGLTQNASEALKITLDIFSMGLTVILVSALSRRQEIKAKELAHPHTLDR